MADITFVPFAEYVSHAKPNNPETPTMGFAGLRCGEAGVFCESADDPPPAPSGVAPPSLVPEVKEVSLEELREGLSAATSAGDASKIVSPFVLKPGG